MIDCESGPRCAHGVLVVFYGGIIHDVLFRLEHLIAMIFISSLVVKFGN